MTSWTKRDKQIRKMIFAAERNLNEKLKGSAWRIRAAHEQHRDALREMQLDRERKWNDLSEKIGELGKALSFIRGKFERDDA